MKYRSFILMAAMAPLVACGFSPVYSERPNQVSVNSNFARTFIQTIPDREGQILYNNLIDRINPKGYAQNPLFELSMSPVQETQIDFDLTEEDNTTRTQMRLNTTMALTDLQSGKTLLKQDLRGVTSFNVLNSEFATRVSEQTARENALRNIADQVQTQLALYFKKHGLPSARQICTLTC